MKRDDGRRADSSSESHLQANASEGRYDFDRLESAVAFLLEEHERLTSEKAALLDELLDREHRITSLQSLLETERVRRQSAVEGVDKILGRLEQLQASVAAAAGTP